MAALHSGDRSQLVIAPNLWAGIGLVRGGAGTALVGNPEQVAARIQEYAALGLETFILSGYPHLEEAHRVAELLFPALGLQTWGGSPTSQRRSLPIAAGWSQAWAAAGRRSRHELCGSRDRGSTAPEQSSQNGGTSALIRTTRLARTLTPWLVPIAGLAVWQLASLSGLLPSRLVPSPLDVARAAARLTISGELARHVAVSARRALLGFLIGGAFGLGLGVLNGLSDRADRLFDTTLQMARAVPHLALVPLIILWLGIGETAKVALVALGVVFPLYINTVHGLRSVDPRLIELGRVHGLGTLALLRRIILPGALSSILVGVRYGLGLMWLGLIVAETISADSGIGYLAMNAREFLQTDVVILSILLYAALGKLADVATRLLEYWLLPWRQASSGAVR